jgi:septum formation protein
MLGVMRLALGSASPWRRQVMERLGCPFEGLSADLDETAIRHPDPSSLALALAHAKADALLPRLASPALLVTCDQVVSCAGELREKPADADQARAWLAGYASQPARTHSAVVVCDSRNGARAAGIDVAEVRLRPIPPATIEDLVAGSVLYSCAGGFALGHPDFDPWLDSIEGTLDSVMGLPLALLERLLGEVAGPAWREQVT